MSSCYTRQQGISTIPVIFLVLSILSLTLPPTLAQTPADSQDEYYNNYGRFSPSMAIIIVVLVAALFFMAFFSIYIRHCSDASMGSTTVRRTTAGGLGRSRRLPRGLEASVIETFPTFVYSTVKGLKIGKGALECAVCLNEFEDHETLRLLPKCDHVFHPECIDAWLASHVTCPVCRANLVPQPGETAGPISGLGTEPEPVSNPDEELGLQGTEQQRCEPDNESRAPEGIDIDGTLNRTRTRGSRSNRMRWFPFPRSHSTGHSLIQPGDNTERFTLRLPADVRKQVVNRKLNRAVSLVVLPREGSSRKGYRTGGDGSSRGKSIKRIDRSDRSAKSDRWVFNMVPPFLSRALSFQSPRVAADDGEGTSRAQLAGPEAATSNEPTRLPV